MEAGNALNAQDKAKSIDDFITTLHKEFRKKSCLHDFITNPIPAAKKNFNINRAETTFDKSTFNKKKKSLTEDNKHSAEIRKIVEEKAKVVANKDLVIADDPDIIKYEKKQGSRSCWGVES